MTLERRSIGQFILDIIPDTVESYIVEHYREIQRTLNAWIRAMLMLSFSIFFITYISLTLVEFIFGFETHRTFTLALISGVMEFIPYIGGAVLVAILTIGALASFDSVGRAVLVPISYLVISAVQNNLASPILYGNRLKLNPVAVLIAVLFWGFLWGAIGAILAVPIVAAIKILCDHIDALSSLGKFLEA